MPDRHTRRIMMHVAAVLAALAMWWIVVDFAAALAASILAFLVVNAVGHIAFGPMPTARDIRRDVEEILRRRD